MEFLPMRDFSEFCENLTDIRGKFQKWDSCERTVALYYLMSGLPFANARFLQYTLEHCITSVLNTELRTLERNANDIKFISTIQWDRPHTAITRLLAVLPLLKPGNREVADLYLAIIRKVLSELVTLPNSRAYNDCVELMSYVFVHPAFDKDDKKSFKLLLKKMMNKSGLFANIEGFGYTSVNEQSSDDSVSPNTEVNIERLARRSNSLTPAQSDSHESLGYSSGVWSSQENLVIPQKPRSYSLSCDPTVPPAPLTSSSSDTRLHDMQQSQQPISKGIIFWLKSLRLHKYSWVFANLNYEQMIALTDEQLQAAGITKGARHKLLISIAKLRERSSMLTQLETEVLNGADLAVALRKLKTILQSPLQTNANEDLPSQFVKVMGKACTQLLMVRHPPDDCVSQFTWLCDRAETLDAFNGEHKRRLGMWKSQLCRAGFNTNTSVQRNNYNSSHNRNGNKANYYGSTSKFQNNHQSTNTNGYNHKSSSYPNMHTKQQQGQPGSTRTSLNNLCPPTAPPLPSICTISTNSNNSHQTPSPSSTSSTSPSSILSNCSLLKATVVTTVPLPTTQPQQVRFRNPAGGGGTNGVTKSQSEQQNGRTDNHNRKDKSVDIESSLENLCLQMMEHALGP